MKLKINSELDTAALANTYSQQGRVQVHDFLEADSAEALYGNIHENCIWNWAFLDGSKRRSVDGKEFNAMIARRQRELMQEIYLQARTEYQQLMFECRLDDDTSVQATKDPAQITAIAEFLGSSEFIEAVNAVTGGTNTEAPDDIYTSWTNRDHFRNDTGAAADQPDGGAVFMLDLAKDWQANWGGVMMFPNDDTGFDECWAPAFNTLNILAAPARHALTYVTSFSEGFRLSVWGHAK